MKKQKLHSLKQAIIGIVAVVVMSVAGGVSADNQTDINIQTYGMLPVIIYNFTPSDIDVNLFANGGASYYGANMFPVAIGWSGGSYFQNGVDGAFVSNISQPGNTGVHSTQACGQLDCGEITYNGLATNMSHFIWFPWWTGDSENNFPTQFQSTNYSSPDTGVFPAGATYDDFTNTVPSGGMASLHTMPGKSTSMINPSSPYIALTVYPAFNLSSSEILNIQIHASNLGYTATAVTPSQTWQSKLLEYLTLAAMIANDESAAASRNTNKMGKAAQNTLNTLINMSKSNAQQVEYYELKSNGIEAVALGSSELLYNNQLVACQLSWLEGDTSASQYGNTFNGQGIIPDDIWMDDAIYITNWKQAQYNSNGGPIQPTESSTDALMIHIINNAFYAAANAGIFLDNINSMDAPLKIKSQLYPDLQRMKRNEGMITFLYALSKNHHEDAQSMIELFGINGRYDNSNGESISLTDIKNRFKELLNRNKDEHRDVEQWLLKLN